MSTRRFFVVFAFIVLFCVCALMYVRPYGRTSIANFALVPNSKQKTILYWNTFFRDPVFYMGMGHVSRDCPRYNNCYTTSSRYLQPIEQFDAVIFHGVNDQLYMSDLPGKRKSSQQYIFVSLESPANRYVPDSFDGYFNATMTYHVDSDIIWSYADVLDHTRNDSVIAPARGRVDWGHNFETAAEDANEEARLTDLIKGKRKLAIWYRSNCHTVSHREKYVEELESYIPVDKYGGCSSRAGCPKNQDCFKTVVEPNYFFYLSFENSLCEDYVTEKFYNALKYHVVPVVYGGANYSRFAPPKSYINALDFNTPNDLAKYLVKLSHNLTEYKKYFDWKRQYRVVVQRQRIVCDLCEFLNGERQKKTYAISKWYNKDRCRLQRQLDRQRSYAGFEYATKQTQLVYA